MSALAIGAVMALKAAGTFMEYDAIKAEGKETAGELRARALGLEAKSSQPLAAASVRARQAQKQGEMTASRALALAAASGASASDPSMIKYFSELSAQAEYNAQAALYEGQVERQNMLEEATATRRRAKNIERASKRKAKATLIRGATSMASSYAAMS